ncbi:hypothetical protein HK099_001096 [Clydaea vesicula]|uniref:Oxidoreductase-like domain-containing protein n=1 Tax=Clydaea vesicula TaxID=447962 RepID=A0AAD5U411_9FUNG|nr:hypothetical protein HK099_001096 [Clydaea vesicula]KAJ3396416.1 hypothetical protein HDU92_003038 [Lobulomyces angularis]
MNRYKGFYEFILKNTIKKNTLRNNLGAIEAGHAAKISRVNTNVAGTKFSYENPGSYSDDLKNYLASNHFNLTKPIAPKSDECCMSGCVKCVWDIYVEDYQQFIKTFQHLKNNLNDKTKLKNSKFDVVREKLIDEIESIIKNTTLEEIDPSVKSFLEMEKSLKKG